MHSHSPLPEVPGFFVLQEAQAMQMSWASLVFCSSYRHHRESSKLWKLPMYRVGLGKMFMYLQRDDICLKLF
jgi:hypothetical protein